MCPIHDNFIAVLHNSGGMVWGTCLPFTELALVFFTMMVNLATGRVDAAIVYAPSTTYLQVCQCWLRAGECLCLVGKVAIAMLKRFGIRTYRPCIGHAYMFVCPCVVVWYLHLRLQDTDSRQCTAWGFACGGPLVCDADMTAYEEAVSQNLVAHISPAALTPLQLQYIHLDWLSKVVVMALTRAKQRFFLWGHVCRVSIDKSASVSMDKFFWPSLTSPSNKWMKKTANRP